MQAYIQSFSNIFIPYRNLIPSMKFTMIGVREDGGDHRSDLRNHGATNQRRTRRAGFRTYGIHELRDLRSVAA